MRRKLSALTATAAVILVGFSAKDRAPRPTPAPSFNGSVGDVSHAELLRYAKALSYNFAHNVAETDRVIISADAGHKLGPVVTIAPEVGWTRITSEDMARGRIAVVIRAEAAVPEFGLAPGNNYLWLEGAPGDLRAFIVPEAAGYPIVQRQMKYLRKHVQDGTGAIVRLTSGGTWIQCPAGCCGDD